ncbi:hypothetical protein V1506DRAFT_522980 [Lipomyces tetrasporus]
MSGSSSYVKQAKAADPEFFHGNRHKLRGFCAQLTIKSVNIESWGNRPCTQYFADFIRIMATLNFDEASEIYQFRNGLRDEVRDLLIGRDVPSDYNEFVHLCIALDNA